MLLRKDFLIGYAECAELELGVPRDKIACGGDNFSTTKNTKYNEIISNK